MAAGPDMASTYTTQLRSGHVLTGAGALVLSEAVTNYQVVAEHLRASRREGLTPRPNPPRAQAPRNP